MDQLELRSDLESDSGNDLDDSTTLLKPSDISHETPGLSFKFPKNNRANRNVGRNVRSRNADFSFTL